MNRYPEHVSWSAHQALKGFSAETLSLDPDMLRERGERVAATLRLFVGDRLPEPAYDAAALLPLARIVQQEGDDRLQGAARWELMEYLTNPEKDRRVSVEAVEYLADIWGDFEVIDEAVLDYQDRIRERNSALGNQVLRSIAVMDDVKIPPEYWAEARAGVNVPKMKEVTHDVNVESVIIGAAELLDNILHEKNPHNKLDLVLRAETFYCPVLDALGLGAMETALRGAALKVRLTYAGREDLINKADEVIAPIKEIGQERVFKALFDTEPQTENTRFHLKDETQYGTTFHFIDTNTAVDLDVKSGPDQVKKVKADVRVQSRVKSSESLAVKMLENPAYEVTLPSDIVGMTAIVQGEAQLAALFSKIAERVDSLENCQFKPAASKKQALFIKGGKDFITSMKNKLPEDLLERIECKQNGESTSAFQVAKMTFVITIDGVEIPVEFQFQTEADRSRAETGDSPHFMQKTKYVPEDMPGNQPGDPDDLVAIRNRKRKWLSIDKRIIAIKKHHDKFEKKLTETPSKDIIDI